jgi:hypothetical protein
MDLRNICLSSLSSIDKLSFPSISIFSSKFFFFCFPNHNGPVFFFLGLSVPSSVFQYHHEGGNFFSEYDQSNCLLRRILFRSVLFSPLPSRTCSLVTSLTILPSPFSSSTTFQSFPNISDSIFLVSRSLSHMKQCSKHIT